MDENEYIIAGKTYRVACLDEFLMFMHAFREDLANAQQNILPYDGGNTGWASLTLDAFLESMQACIADHASAGNELKVFEGSNCWTAITEALMMGRCYE